LTESDWVQEYGRQIERECGMLADLHVGMFGKIYLPRPLANFGPGGESMRGFTHNLEKRHPFLGYWWRVMREMTLEPCSTQHELG
jgi:hypothetical protein